MKGQNFEINMIMFPAGHAANKVADLEGILEKKFHQMGKDTVENHEEFIRKPRDIGKATNRAVKNLYESQIKYFEKSIDE